MIIFTEVPWTDWEIPWAGIGSFLLGVGGTLSGLAALMSARNRGRNDATGSTTVSKSGNGGGSRISGSDSDESGSSPYEDGNN
jgi:hypothetical protein